jgi:LemA protein
MAAGGGDGACGVGGRGADGIVASVHSAGADLVAASADLAGVAAAVAAEALAGLAAAAAAAVAPPEGGSTLHIMKRASRIALNLTVLLVAVALSGCSYNRFTTQEEAIKAQWAEVQNQLQRRNDLIPNLVETVKGYAAHETGIFKDIADARSRLLAAKSPDETIQAANAQTSALGRLLAVVENYPNLKADAQFLRLQDELGGTENRLATARMRYNERVQEYNTQRRRFPSNVTAKMFGFKEYPYWEVPPEARQAPKVNFGR